MPAASSGLSTTLHRLSHEFWWWYETECCRELLGAIWQGVIQPCFVVLAITAVVLQSYLWLRQTWRSPTAAAADYHVQAVVLYQQKLAQPMILATTKQSSSSRRRRGHNNDPKKQPQLVTPTQKHFRPVVKLLQRSLQYDPNYVPASLSLAALYLYQEGLRHPAQALSILQPIIESDDNKSKSKSELNQMILALKRDAQALQQGASAQMLQDVLRQDEYLHPSSVALLVSASATATTTTSNGGSSTTITTKPKMQ